MNPRENEMEEQNQTDIHSKTIDMIERTMLKKSSVLLCLQRSVAAIVLELSIWPVVMPLYFSRRVAFGICYFAHPRGNSLSERV